MLRFSPGLGRFDCGAPNLCLVHAPARLLEDVKCFDCQTASGSSADKAVSCLFLR